ncbi:MAG: aromatic ring-hydroxylating dioxygenase subunit alpha, partial [Pseudomonadota bacterium]
MADDGLVEAPGAARCPGPSTKDIILADDDDAPAAIVAEAYEFLGDKDIPYSRYTSRAFLELETEKMWSRVWQYACREEHIPDPGDTYVYDVGPYSILVARTDADEIKAYINSCKHRGMQLRPSGSRGCLKQLRCPFHGFTWNLDGSLKEIPCQWDFPHVDEEAFALDEVRVDTWAGFVFVNMDEAAPPLEQYLEVLPDHFKAWGLENRFTTLHIEKILPANWKLAQEAFLEAYHVLATHSQAVKTAGDANAQYDVFGENVTRFVHTLGYPSPHLKTPITQDQIVAALGLDESHKVPEGGTARQVYADYLRGALGEKFGVDLSNVSTTEMIDSIEYHCFPNFFVFPGVSLPMVYRFRPNGDDV